MEKDEIRKGLAYILIAQALNFLALAAGIVGEVLLTRGSGLAGAFSVISSSAPVTFESVLLSAAALLSLAALVLYLTGLVKASRGDYGFHPAIWFVLLGASAGLLGSYLQNSGNMFASIAGLISVLFDLLAVRCVICTADEAIGFGARKFLIPILILYALMLLLTLASAVLELTGYIQSYSYWIGLITSFLALISTAYYASALITARKK